MKISFGNQYDPYKQKMKQAKENAVKFNDFAYQVADPPVNLLLRYKIKSNIIPNDKLRHTINDINRMQAEYYSMTLNPLYIPNKIVHYNETIKDTKNIAQKTKDWIV